jgi:tungstate transport system substrate-binding protein
MMSVNPEKHENVNYEGAQAFVDYMIDDATQTLIGEFKKYDEQLFVPNAA